MFESLLGNWLFVRLLKNLGAGQLVEELWEECLVKLGKELSEEHYEIYICLLYTSPSPRDKRQSRMPSSA